MCRREPGVSPSTQSTIFLNIYYVLLDLVSDTTGAIQSAQIEVDCLIPFIKFYTMKILVFNVIYVLISENSQIIRL